MNRFTLLLLLPIGCSDFELNGVKESAEAGYRQLQVDPVQVDFGVRQDLSEVTELVTLTSIGSSAVTVSDLSLSGSGAFTVTALSGDLLIEPGESADVAVAYTPLTWDDQADLIVQSDAVEPSMRVGLYGAGLFPGIEIDPVSVAFTSVSGESVHEEITLRSVGTADLDLSQMVVQGEEFTVTGEIPLLLAPGEETVLDATWQPLVEGEISSGKIWLTTNTAEGFSVVPLEGEWPAPCMGLGEAWDRGLLDASSMFDGSTLDLINLSSEEEICIDTWYIWRAPSSQDLAAGSMEDQPGELFPSGTLTMAPGTELQFGPGAMSGPSWWCVEHTQYTSPNKAYVFTGARVPEPLYSWMLEGDQDAIWDWMDENPVVLAARQTNYVELPASGGSAEVTIEVLNAGSMASTAEVWETIGEGFSASGFSLDPDHVIDNKNGSISYVFYVDLDARDLTGSSTDTDYDALQISYTLSTSECTGRETFSPMMTMWTDGSGTERTDTAIPLVVACE